MLRKSGMNEIITTSQSQSPSRPTIMKQLAVLGLAVVFCVLYLLVGNLTGIYFPCVFYEITHWYCPGCGITRMLIATLTGNFYQAFRYNYLLFILLPFGVILSVDFLISRWKGRTSLLTRIPDIVWIVLIVILIIYGIARNLPWFSFLAPIEITDI